jgi:hypothetical protein
MWGWVIVPGRGKDCFFSPSCPDQVWQGTGPVGQVETSPEIFLVYRAHLVMIVHKISAADILCSGTKELLKFWMYSSNLRQRACVMAARLAVMWYSLMPSNRVRGPGADEAIKDSRNVTHTHISTYIWTIHFILGIKQSSQCTWKNYVQNYAL